MAIPSDQRDEQPESIDWRDIFIRYTSIVGDNEGGDFLYPENWSLGEWREIRLAVGHLRLPDYPLGPHPEEQVALEEGP